MRTETAVYYKEYFFYGFSIIVVLLCVDQLKRVAWLTVCVCRENILMHLPACSCRTLLILWKNLNKTYCNLAATER